MEDEKGTRETQHDRQELEQALEMAERKAAAKTEFLSCMSHEIRTPINTIMGVTSIAREHCDDREVLKDCMDKIDISSQYLLTLLNDILDISRIEMGKLHMMQERFSVTALVNGVQTMTEVLARKSGVSYIIRNRVDEQAWFYGDFVRTQQILVNIITNAVKFTPGGGAVTFEIDCGKESEKGTELIFTVTDTGIGMKKEFVAHMFEPFVQADSQMTQTQQGSGLGLAIAKHLIDAMCGTIVVESVPASGSAFRICIPFQRAEALQEGMRETCDWHRQLRQRVNLEGCRILMAEDHPLNTLVVTKLLERKGAIVTQVDNGREAVDKFCSSEQEYYDVILMDIRMPVMDGLEATKRIRTLERLDAQAILIIAMTANALAEDRQRTKEAGMTAHLTKPFAKELLYQTVAEALHGR